MSITSNKNTTKETFLMYEKWLFYKLFHCLLNLMTTEHIKEHTDETSTSVQAMQLDPNRQQQNGLTGEWL